MPTEPCIHHWRIETPAGAPEVQAHCYTCGASRTFPTAAQEPPPAWKEQPHLAASERSRGTRRHHRRVTPL